MAQIGEGIESGFGSGKGTIGCFLKGNFFETNDCVIALTAAHVLFALEGDFSAKSMSKGIASVEEGESEPATKFVPNPYGEKADAFLREHAGDPKTRDDVCRWARNDKDYKEAAGIVREKYLLRSVHPRTDLFKPALAPKGFVIPYNKRVYSESDWGLAIVTKFGTYDNTPKALPAGVAGAWAGWTAPKKGDRVFKYGVTTSLTEGQIDLDPDDRTFSVKGLKGRFSGEGDSGAGVFSVGATGSYQLIGILYQGGMGHSSILRIDYILTEIRTLYGVDAQKA